VAQAKNYETRPGRWAGDTLTKLKKLAFGHLISRFRFVIGQAELLAHITYLYNVDEQHQIRGWAGCCRRKIRKKRCGKEQG